MPTLVATVGASNANSYVTVATADTYFDERVNTSAWDDASTDNQERALIMATRRLDQEHYKGEPVKPLTDVEVSATTSTQALKWPRYSTYDDSGWAFDHEEIPVIVQHATMELALRVLNDGSTDTLADTGLEQFESVKIGPIDVVPRLSYRAGRLPETVERLLRPVLATVSGGFRVRRT